MVTLKPIKIKLPIFIVLNTNIFVSFVAVWVMNVLSLLKNLQKF